MANDKSLSRSRSSAMLRGIKGKLARTENETPFSTNSLGEKSLAGIFVQEKPAQDAYRIPDSRARDFDFEHALVVPQARTTREDIQRVLANSQYSSLSSPTSPSPYPYPELARYARPLLSPTSRSLPPSPSFSVSTRGSDAGPITPVTPQFPSYSSAWKVPEVRRHLRIVQPERRGECNDSPGVEPGQRRRPKPLALPPVVRREPVVRKPTSPSNSTPCPVLPPVVVRPPPQPIHVAPPASPVDPLMNLAEPGRETQVDRERVNSGASRSRSSIPPLAVVEEGEPEEDDWTLGLTSKTVKRGTLNLTKTTLVAMTEEEAAKRSGLSDMPRSLEKSGDECEDGEEVTPQIRTASISASYFAMHPTRRKAISSAQSAVESSSSSIVDSGSSTVDSCSLLESGSSDHDTSPTFSTTAASRRRVVSFSPYRHEYTVPRVERRSSAPDTSDIEHSLKKTALALEEAGAILLAKRRADGWED